MTKQAGKKPPSQRPATLVDPREGRRKERPESCQYCKRNNLSYHTINYWYRNLSHLSRPQSFIPVNLPPALIRNGGKHNETDLHIILPGKMSVAVGDNFSPETLSRLLTVLENR